MKRIVLNLIIAVVLLVGLVPGVASASATPARTLPAWVTDSKLETPIEEAGVTKLHPSMAGLQGTQKVWVILTEKAVSQVAIDGGDFRAQRSQLRLVKAQQDKFASAVKALDASAIVLGGVQRVINAVVVQADGAKLAELAKNPAVKSIGPYTDYELDLADTVPYIGASAVQASGFTGKGVKVGVIDSGIDYTHVAFGGSGSVAEYTANDPNVIEPGTFPTKKVVGGYDFVGANWPNTAEEPDPDPLDKGSNAGHGTHVAHIIGGVGGVAPDVKLYGLKVCSSVSTSCSGLAIMQAYDWAMDPNGDGHVWDHLDVVNLSIGSPYGHVYDEADTVAISQLTFVGTTVVASAGNNNNYPYVTNPIAGAPSAVSVAATTMPKANYQMLTVLTPASIAGDIAGLWQNWSAPVTGVIEAPVQYADGAGGNKLGCNAFAPGSLAGKIVLVDRGTCAISIKVGNIADAGGLAAIVALVAAGEPTTFSYGGGNATVPGFNITLADGNKIKSGLAAGVTMRIDPANLYPLNKVMQSYSSRGPILWNGYIKPDIGAPSDSISAVAGTGNGVSPFSGTSGASPMVAGTAALLKQAFPWKRPLEFKAMLVNNAETEVYESAALFGGALAPITRIGGGEVRVDRAAAAPAIAWDLNTKFPNLSFLQTDVTGVTTLEKTVIVRNFSERTITYKVTPTFRYQNDIDTGAVTVMVYPETITVGPASSWKNQANVKVLVTIDGAKLRQWTLNSGSSAMNPAPLTLHEYDGYLWFQDLAAAADAPQMHMPWQVLPRQSGNVVASANTFTPVDGMATVDLTNTGVGPVYVDTYSLIGTSPDNPAQAPLGGSAPIIDLKAAGIATYAVPAGYCSSSASYLVVLAVSTWERQVLLGPEAEYDWYLDVNQDGTWDYVVYNYFNSYSAGDYRSVTKVVNLATNTVSAWFYADHGTNDSNTAMPFCAEQIGGVANIGKPWTVDVIAWDVWWGNYGDDISGMVVTPGLERFWGVVNDIAPGGTETMTVYDFGATPNSTETGVLAFLNVVRSARAGSPVGNDQQIFTLLP